GVCAEPGTQDLLFARARLVDRNGTTVPVSGRMVRFTATGNLTLVGPQEVAAEAGIASALLRVSGQEPAGELVAQSAELTGTATARNSPGCISRERM
ncbi:MAG TPA: hypothetical protein VIL25_09560, partial [Vicinamibacterales bacterium]